MSVREAFREAVRIFNDGSELGVVEYFGIGTATFSILLSENLYWLILSVFGGVAVVGAIQHPAQARRAALHFGAVLAGLLVLMAATTGAGYLIAKHTNVAEVQE